MTIDQPSKEEGVIGLHPILADSELLPLSKDMLGNQLRVCAKCGRGYIWAGRVKRSYKGSDYWYIQIKHYNKRNKRKKIKYCYLKIRE